MKKRKKKKIICAFVSTYMRCFAGVEMNEEEKMIPTRYKESFI